MPGAIPLPLSNWAQERIDRLEAWSDGAQFPSADALMRERAVINRHLVAGVTSSGGGCRFYAVSDGHVALNLARGDDHELLPALFGLDSVDDIEAAFQTVSEAEVVGRGRLLGMAIAGLNETPVSPALTRTTGGLVRTNKRQPRVLDLSALWAGPLASRLLALAGCEVTRIESVGREDPLRHSDPAHFEALNAGKVEVALDLKSDSGMRDLLGLVEASDIVIEAARPRALSQLGLDADALVRAQPGLVWMTITGHGIVGEAADWVAFGDDAGVAGGLSRELRAASGMIGFVGDAIADPLTGIATASAALAQLRGGSGARMVVSMSGLIARAIADEKNAGPVAWQESLQAWASRVGQPYASENSRHLELVAC